MILQKIAELVGGEVKGNAAIDIAGVGSLEDAAEGHIVFLEKKSFLGSLRRSRASAVIVAEELETDKAQVVASNPKLAFARVVALFHPQKRPPPRIDPRAAIGENVSLGKDVTVSAWVSIGAHTVIGDQAVLYPGVAVGEGCHIGGGSTLHPNVTLYPGVIIGKNVILHAGAVVGADGFGYAPDEQGRHFKVNQIGGVVIEDDVEVGANACIDRASMGITLIKQGVKIDNLAQIAHNCSIGEHSIIVSQSGMGGSCTLGHHVILAGQVGLADHVTLGDRVVMAARSGTFRDVESGQVHGGSPSVPLTSWKKYVSLLPSLPELVRKIRGLDRRLTAVEKKPAGGLNKEVR